VQSVKRLTAECGEFIVVITIHFQERWAERVGTRLILPIDRLVRTFKAQACGEYRTRCNSVESKPCLVVSREPYALRLITVITGAFLGTIPPWIPMLEAA
jgi:hypothetical protein